MSCPVVSEPFTGKVKIIFTKENARVTPYTPRILAEFDEIQPGKSMVINELNAVSYPVSLSWFSSGEYVIKTFMEWKNGNRIVIAKPEKMYVGEKPFQQISLVCDEIQKTENMSNKYKDKKYIKYVKYVSIPSERLSKFYKKPTNMEALIRLPEAWFKETERKFPVLIQIWRPFDENKPGFLVDEIPTILVFIKKDYYANSSNKGPVGDALVYELIPAIEKKYRGIGHRDARFVWGQSTGGYATAWLMVNYPDFFGYGWAGAPDYIDFRNLGGVNIYKPNTNLFYDEEGFLRPVKTDENGNPIESFKSECRRELFHNNPWRMMLSFFSPCGVDGKPTCLWNRETGEIDPAVANHWRKYDISYILRTRWEELSSKLSGRFSITVGLQDEYFIDDGVKLLKKEMEAIGAEIRFALYPGSHSRYLTQEVFDIELKEMMKIFRQSNFY